MLFTNISNTRKKIISSVKKLLLWNWSKGYSVKKKKNEQQLVFSFHFKELPQYNWNIVETGVKHYNPLINFKVIIS
jgi:hypothetical protein